MTRGDLPKPDDQMHEQDALHMTPLVPALFDAVSKCAAVCLAESEQEFVQLYKNYMGQCNAWAEAQMNDGVRKGDTVTYREMHDFLYKSFKYLQGILEESPK
jgi:hypothetical protein